MKNVVILEAAIGEDGRTYLYPDRYSRIDRPDLYQTYVTIQGKLTDVIIFSDDMFDYKECRRLAIAYMTGRYNQWSFDLSEYQPRWRKTK